MNLGKNVKIQVALEYTDGTADREGDEFDMQGWDGVLMIVTFAAIHDSATLSIKAQQDTVTGMGTAADLYGTEQTVSGTSDDQIFIIDLYKPLERYVRLYVDKDTSNTVAESAIYIGYSGRVSPFDNDADAATNYELHVSPIEGTA